MRNLIVSKVKDFVESASVAIVLLVVLLPVRLLFVEYVSTDWLGSFGVVSAITAVLFVLAKKNKMGWFGRAYHRQLFKANRGKRRYLIYFNISVGIIFFSATIYGINLGHTDYQTEVTQVKEMVPASNMQELVEQSSQETKPEHVPLAIILFIFILLFRFDVFSVLMSALNDISNGWILHFATVFLVELLEVAGILIFAKFTVKKESV